MNPDPVVAAPGQVGKFDERIVINTEIVLPAKTHFRAPVLGFDLIALDDGQVHHRRFRPQVAGPLDDDIPLDKGQPDKAPAVIILVLGESSKSQEGQDRNQQGCLFHLRSPYTPD
jgi:hypothetical protein